MKKMYNFRLDPNLIKRIDSLDGSRTHNVTSALRSYLQNDLPNSYNVDLSYLQHLEEEIVYLRKQNEVLMVVKIPLLSKIKMKLLNNRT